MSARGELGEIVIRGHNIMKGYYNREDATKESIDATAGSSRATWPRRTPTATSSSSTARRSSSSAAATTSTRAEIEEVLYEHPAIAEVAVVGIPDDNLGEEVGAAVVLKSGQDVDVDEIQAYVKKEVANYRVPAPHLAARRAAQGADGQDSQAGDQGARARRDQLIACRVRADSRAGGLLGPPARELDARVLVERHLAHANDVRGDLDAFVLADELEGLVERELLLGNEADETSDVDLRMFVRCFSLTAFTSRSSDREFSPTIIPS
jgi:hypothetical protein